MTTDTVDKLVYEITYGDPQHRPEWISRIGADSLVIVDEAGLASTRNLDATIAHVTGRGGRVLLVGDDRQRAATGAGGVLRDIDATYGSSSLVEVMRFTDPTEGQATLAIRDGDPAAAGFTPTGAACTQSPPTPPSPPCTPHGPPTSPPDDSP